MTLPEVKPYPIVAAKPTVANPILLIAVQRLLPWKISPTSIPPVLIATVLTPTPAFCVNGAFHTLISKDCPVAVRVVTSPHPPVETEVDRLSAFTTLKSL